MDAEEALDYGLIDQILEERVEALEKKWLIKRRKALEAKRIRFFIVPFVGKDKMKSEN